MEKTEARMIILAALRQANVEAEKLLNQLDDISALMYKKAA